MCVLEVGGRWAEIWDRSNNVNGRRPRHFPESFAADDDDDDKHDKRKSTPRTRVMTDIAEGAAWAISQ